MEGDDGEVEQSKCYSVEATLRKVNSIVVLWGR